MAAFAKDENGGYLTSCDGTNRVSGNSPSEIRCGTSCECVKRNGLQNECNIPNCVNKIKKNYEIKTSFNSKSQRNEIEIKPVSILPQDASYRMPSEGIPLNTYRGQFPYQPNNGSYYEKSPPKDVPQYQLDNTIPKYPQHQQPSQNLQPVRPEIDERQNPQEYQHDAIPKYNPQSSQNQPASLTRAEIEERQDKMINSMVARRNALHEKEMICPEQCPEKMLDCNYFQNAYSNAQQQYNSNDFSNPHYKPVNPYNPQQQYIINHYEPGGKDFPHHCIPNSQNLSIPRHQSSPQYVATPNQINSTKLLVENNPSQQYHHTPGQPVQYQMQPCCVQQPPEPCCNPPPCCELMISGNPSSPQYHTHHLSNNQQFMPSSNGRNMPTLNESNIPPLNGGNTPLSNGDNLPYQYYHSPQKQYNMSTNNAPHQNQNLITNNVDIPYQHPNMPMNEVNSQYVNNDQIYKQPYQNSTGPICYCHLSSPGAFETKTTHGYESQFDQKPPVDLVGNQYGQVQSPALKNNEATQLNNRRLVEPLVPEPQELTEYPPQIRKYHINGQECK